MTCEPLSCRLQPSCSQNISILFRFIFPLKLSGNIFQSQNGLEIYFPYISDKTPFGPWKQSHTNKSLMRENRETQGILYTMVFLLWVTFYTLMSHHYLKSTFLKAILLSTLNGMSVPNLSAQGSGIYKEEKARRQRNRKAWGSCWLHSIFIHNRVELMHIWTLGEYDSIYKFFMSSSKIKTHHGRLQVCINSHP